VDRTDGELCRRTKAFSLRIIGLANARPDAPVAQVIQRQILKSGTSVGANYRAAMRAKSVADFVAKMGIVEEEADETMYWMELLAESGLVLEERLSALYGEADEILAMVVASIRTARRKSPAGGSAPHSALRTPRSALRAPHSL
jgi:four helix bundle protein